MSEIRNTPKLRFSNFSDSYKKLTFGDIFKSLPTGMTPSRAKKEYFQGDIPWITSGELEYNEVYQTIESITEEAVNQTNLKVYPRGTFFIAITGLEAPGTRGRCAINAVPATTNQSCMAFQESDKVINRFLFYWYLRYGVKLYFKYAQGSKQQSFNAGIVKSFELNIPSISEQQKIADFLTAVDKRIELLEKKKTLLETYKKGVIKKIFNQEIRFKDDNGNDFPDWEEKRLGNVATLKNGYSFKSSSYSENGIHSIITISNVQEGKLLVNDCKKVDEIPSDISEHQILEFEDLLISMTGNVGRVAKVNQKGCLLNQRVGKIVPFDISLNYLFQVLNNTRFRNKMISNSQGGAQPNLSKSDIENYTFNCPLRDEQEKISTFLSSIDDQIELMESHIDKSKTWKKGLLQKMFV